MHTIDSNSLLLLLLHSLYIHFQEKDVDLDYLTTLHEKHESWLVDQKVK